MTKVFVYGTLKRGYGNNRLLADAQFLSVAWTRRKFRMLDVGFPVLRPYEDQDYYKASVEGELYECDDRTLEALDRLESEGRMYDRKIIEVVVNGSVVRVHAYIGRTEHWSYRNIIPKAPVNGIHNWKREL
jgi:gamma-glutamylaminecyclotransferase